MLATGRVVWIRPALWLLRTVCGISAEVRGAENIPAGPCIFASKHQSNWDVLFYLAHVPQAVFVAKRELLFVPLFGFFMWRAGTVALNRAGGSAELRRMTAVLSRRCAAGKSIVIFPEGTRRAPGAPPAYRGGVAVLAHRLEVPVVPVALNSGYFWGRRRFLKRPGRIVVSFLPPLPRARTSRQLLSLLEERIEAECNRLSPPASAPPPTPTAPSARANRTPSS